MLLLSLLIGFSLFRLVSVFLLAVALSPVLQRIRGCKMGRAIGQRHYYCSASFASDAWLIYESRCKAKGIEGGCIYCAPSRHYAYKIAKVLNELYRLGRLGALARWKFVCKSSPCTRDHAIMDLHFAEDLLSPDDSKFLSVSIIGGQNA